ncbi:tubulin-like doman-containing protein [Deinococcus misasensis]|uniref:tubulin-like doman-containing protein n=1 Tax=Deinococcus misasensis TaxID=392413 RepID=UPI00055519FB|nr:tubulin-like doman-containing protein [Deinococcus misasensis]
MSTYIKTLVIGLGSTGTRICNELVRRIEWELGGLEKAPWVRFLAIETNSNEPTPLKKNGDFRSIGFRTAEYNDILQNMSAYNERIALDDWADIDTLKKLPDPEGGAGNIRMVGRLALLYGENFENIKLSVLSRVEQLRDLKEAKAQEARGPLPDGTNPEVTFAADGQVRIFIVGTLCGGTCSGLAPDFGYFLRSFLGQEKLIGIFTLPHPNSVHPYAQRIKKNSYSALVELNHHHLSQKGDPPPIRFPDGSSSERFKKVPPYDLPYLVMPNKATTAGEAEIINMVADRIFLNVFTPSTDPYSNSVDSGTFDLENQAHVFCTFGLATVEVPAQQLTEACTSKLLLRSLRRWQDSHDVDTDSVLERVGLSWNRLKALLLARDGTERELEQNLRDQVEEISRQAETQPEKIRAALEAFRLKFKSGEGSVATGVKANVPRVVESIYGRLKEYGTEVLGNLYEGPDPFKKVIKAGIDWVQEVSQNLTPTSSDEARRNVDALIVRLEEPLKRGLFGVNKNQQAQRKEDLRQFRNLLLEEMEARIDELTHQALSNQTVRGKTEKGLLERIKHVLIPIQNRIRGLEGRVTHLTATLDRRVQELSREAPPLVGLTIFEPNSSVEQEYRRCLQEWLGDPSSTFEDAQNLAAEQVVSSWTEVPELLMPPLNVTSEDDFLSRPFLSGSDEPLPEPQQKRMWQKALEPFMRLANVDVLERWSKLGIDQSGADPAMRARDAAQMARPFLRVDRNQAEKGNRSRILNVTSLLLPNHVTDSQKNEFKTAISSVFAANKGGSAYSPQRFRIVLLNEWYRFPLRGLTDVLGSGGIHEAQCEDFPTFHTRRDIYWLGLSPREGNLLRETEELLVLGVLLEVVQIKAGRLTFPMKGMGGAMEDRFLPLSFFDAARMLAREHRDLRGGQLKGARAVLKARVEQKWHQSTATPEESSEQFVRLLIDQVNAFFLRYPDPAKIVRDWGSKEWTWEYVVRYIAKSKDLFAAYQRISPPDQEILARLWLEKGDRGLWGGVVPEPGFYCEHDGGLIGKTPEEAAQNGWRCFINPEHHFGDQLDKASQHG